MNSSAGFSKTDTNKAKGLAVLLLIFHHMYRTSDNVQYWGVDLHVFTDEGVSKIAFCFRIAVFMFCFLSAYGISCSVKEKRTNLRFVLYRLWRLLSPYWFTLLALNIYFLIRNHKIFYSDYTPSPLTFFGDVIPVWDILGHSEYMFNTVLWYMNLTLVMILIFPLVYKLISKAGILTIILSVLIYNMIPIGVYSIYGGPYIQYLFALEFGICFSVNNLFGKIRSQYSKFNKYYKALCFFVLLVLSGVCPYLAWFVIPDDIFGIKAILHTLGGLSAILIVFLFTDIKALSIPLNLLGIYSADIYLTHLYVNTGFSFLLFKINNIFLQFVAAAALCLGVSYTLYLLKKYTGWSRLISSVSKRISPKS